MGPDAEAVVPGEVHEERVELPRREAYLLHVVVQDRPRAAPQRGERPLVAADQRLQPHVGGQLHIQLAREAQLQQERIDRHLPAPGIPQPTARCPVRLPLLARAGLVPHRRLRQGRPLRHQRPHVAPHHVDPAGIPLRRDLLVQPHGAQPRLPVAVRQVPLVRVQRDPRGVYRRLAASPAPSASSLRTVFRLCPVCSAIARRDHPCLAKTWTSIQPSVRSIARSPFPRDRRAAPGNLPMPRPTSGSLFPPVLGHYFTLVHIPVVGEGQVLGERAPVLVTRPVSSSALSGV